MPSKIRDIAEILGVTETSNTSNAALITAAEAGGGGGGATSYDSAGAFPDSGTVGAFAFATNKKALYTWDGTEWDRIQSGVDEGLIWDSELSATTFIRTDDTTGTLMHVSALPDFEGYPITYSYQTLPANPVQLDSANPVIDSAVNGNFTINPSSRDSDVGSFRFVAKATDGLHTITSISTVTLVSPWAGAYSAVDFTSGTAQTYGTNVGTNQFIGGALNTDSDYANLAGSTGNFYVLGGIEPYTKDQDYTFIYHVKNGKVWSSSNAWTHNRGLFRMIGGRVYYRDANGSDTNSAYLTSNADDATQTTVHGASGWGAVLVVRFTGGVANIEFMEFNAATGALVDGTDAETDDNYNNQPVGSYTDGWLLGAGGLGAVSSGGGNMRQAAFFNSVLTNAQITTLIQDNISIKI